MSSADQSDKTKRFSKTFKHPDERRDFFSHGHLDLLKFEDGTEIGLGVFEPGWRWSNDVKPIAGTKSCEAAHTGYCLKGSMTIRMDSGEEIKIKAGDAIHILPGHDAWVDGEETCELLDVTGYANYAVRKKEFKKGA